MPNGKVSLRTASVLRHRPSCGTGSRPVRINGMNASMSNSAVSVMIRSCQSPGGTVVQSDAEAGGGCGRLKPNSDTSATHADMHNRNHHAADTYPSPEGRATTDSGLQRLRFLLDVVQSSDVEERLLGNVVELTLGDLVERLDGLGDLHVGPVLAGELLGHEEVLAQEPLHPPSPADGQLVLLGQLVHAQDGDDVLQLLVLLQDPDDLTGHP